MHVSSIGGPVAHLWPQFTPGWPPQASSSNKRGHRCPTEFSRPPSLDFFLVPTTRRPIIQGYSKADHVGVNEDLSQFEPVQIPGRTLPNNDRTFGFGFGVDSTQQLGL